MQFDMIDKSINEYAFIITVILIVRKLDKCRDDTTATWKRKNDDTACIRGGKPR